MNKEIITFIKYHYFIKLNFNRRAANYNVQYIQMYFIEQNFYTFVVISYFRKAMQKIHLLMHSFTFILY